ncbi:MAG: hypothetical protein AAF502_01940 [Bacteroidota bacterium]
MKTNTIQLVPNFKISRLLNAFLLTFSFLITSISNTYTQPTVKVSQENRNGLLTTSFATIEGDVTVYMPAYFSAGETISGTVKVQPEGKNDRQVAKNSAALNGYVIEIENQQRKGPGKATWAIPAGAYGTAVTYLLLKDRNGNTVGRQSIPLQPEGFNSGHFTENGFNIPDHFQTTSPVEISGRFDGEIDNTTVDFNGETGQILAESQTSAFVDVPERIEGPVEVTITENGETVSGTSNIIDLSLAADQLSLQSGENATITMTVTGMEGMDTPVDVTIANLTPNVISMPTGMTDIITIDPSDVLGNGSFVHEFPVTGNIPGGFSIGADIHSAESHDYISRGSNSNNKSETNRDEQQVPEENTAPIITNPEEIQNFTEAITFQEPGLEIPGEVEEVISHNNGIAESLFSEVSYGAPAVANIIAPAVLATILIDITEEERRELRNRARDIEDETTDLNPSDPDDRDAPYSRPVPSGIRGDDYEQGSFWRDAEALRDQARRNVQAANRVTGHPSPGDPGYGDIGLLTPGETNYDPRNGCTDYVYVLQEIYPYWADVTLVHEEQLSPSSEYLVAHGTTEINITQHTSSWEVGFSAGVGVRGLSIGVNSKYGESTTHITGTTVSRFMGRQVWFFHIGRLHLHRKAYLLITYTYHYQVCEDGSTSNWVEIKYEDNWYYAYKWTETMVMASRDNDGNFHEIETIPLTSSIVEEDHYSYEAESLDQDEFTNPGATDFFPEVQ